jgi:hypothetical protein
MKFDTIDLGAVSKNNDSGMTFAACPLTFCPYVPRRILDPCVSLPRSAV